MDKDSLPAPFVSRMRDSLGKDESRFFIDCLDQPAPTSIHLHPYKPSQYKNDKESLESIPWSSNGFYLSERPRFTIDPGFQAGGYYVQEASSMLIEIAFRIALKDHKSPRVLDLCAAPGGKSTLILSLLNESGLLISNEIIQSRLEPLIHNIIKWGYPNQVITSADPERFNSLPSFFEIILIDAPCSGEGLFRKDKNSRNEWSEKLASECVLRQQRILKQASDALAPGGYLIYSTCTFNAAENMDQIIRLSESGFTSVQMPELKGWGIEEQIKHACIGYQAYPHKVKGEGFFLSLLRKTGTDLQNNHATTDLEWVHTPDFIERFMDMDHLACFAYHDSYFIFPAGHQHDLETIRNTLRIIQAGTPCGSFKQKDFIPHHGMSQCIHLKQDIPSIELNGLTALDYLKRNALPNDENKKGYFLATINSQKLGWVKGVPGRFNNLLPHSHRIKGNYD